MRRSLRHDVWFLDAVTALNHMRAAQTLGIQTFALWRLGGEDRSLWRVWDVPGDAGAADKAARTCLRARMWTWKARAKFCASKTGRRTALAI